MWSPTSLPVNHRTTCRITCRITCKIITSCVTTCRITCFAGYSVFPGSWRTYYAPKGRLLTPTLLFIYHRYRSSPLYAVKQESRSPGSLFTCHGSGMIRSPRRSSFIAALRRLSISSAHRPHIYSPSLRVKSFPPHALHSFPMSLPKTSTNRMPFSRHFCLMRSVTYPLCHIVSEAFACRFPPHAGFGGSFGRQTAPGFSSLSSLFTSRLT